LRRLRSCDHQGRGRGDWSKEQQWPDSHLTVPSCSAVGACGALAATTARSHLAYPTSTSDNRIRTGAVQVQFETLQ
jgi:hypothetical protein